MRIFDQKLYEAARLRGYLHCFRLVLGVQKLYEAVITSLSFYNPFEIGLMKRVRYLVEVLGVRYFAEVFARRHLMTLCIGAERSQFEKIYTVTDKQDQQ